MVRLRRLLGFEASAGLGHGFGGFGGIKAGWWAGIDLLGGAAIAWTYCRCCLVLRNHAVTVCCLLACIRSGRTAPD